MDLFGSNTNNNSLSIEINCLLLHFRELSMLNILSNVPVESGIENQFRESSQVKEHENIIFETASHVPGVVHEVKAASLWF